jgi:hypothetical protein
MAQVMLREVGPQVAEYPWELIRRAVCRVLYLQQRGHAVMNSGLGGWWTRRVCSVGQLRVC